MTPNLNLASLRAECGTNARHRAFEEIGRQVTPNMSYAVRFFDSAGPEVAGPKSPSPLEIVLF
jgi:hypothetical protein